MGKYLGHESMIKVKSHNILIHFVYIAVGKHLRDIVVSVCNHFMLNKTNDKHFLCIVFPILYSILLSLNSIIATDALYVEFAAIEIKHIQ